MVVGRSGNGIAGDCGVPFTCACAISSNRGFPVRSDWRLSLISAAFGRIRTSSSRGCCSGVGAGGTFWAGVRGSSWRWGGKCSSIGEHEGDEPGDVITVR
jgi:hypothetical protein